MVANSSAGILLWYIRWRLGDICCCDRTCFLRPYGKIFKSHGVYDFKNLFRSLCSTWRGSDWQNRSSVGFEVIVRGSLLFSRITQFAGFLMWKDTISPALYKWRKVTVIWRLIILLMCRVFLNADRYRVEQMVLIDAASWWIYKDRCFNGDSFCQTGVHDQKVK